MIVFPAIDLIAGKVVRLERGDRARMKVYSDDPVAVAEEFRSRGAAWIHVVDLSATLEEDAAAQAANASAIAAICGVEGIRVDAGGGVRSLAAFERLLSLGVERVAVGTALVRDPAFAEQVARTFGAHAVADIAARDGRVKVNGWRDDAALSADELIARLADVVASGGVASVADIAALAALGPDVIEGAICGRAIFEGSLKLEDALAAAGGEGAC